MNTPNSSPESRLMAHMVSHFPDRDRSLAVADGLVTGGASYLEIQFPFSDPTADGPVIQAACQRALDAGFTVEEGIRLVAEVRSRYDIPVFVMSYASLVYARGVREFLVDGKDAGASGFILPDLPLDYDEGAYGIGRELNVDVMPVIVTSMTDARLGILESVRPRYLYVALRQGITGSRTELDDANLGFLDRLAPLGARVMAGFGVSERTQVAALEPHVHAVIVGSALVANVAEVARQTEHAGADESADRIRSAVANQVASLVGRS